MTEWWDLALQDLIRSCWKHRDIHIERKHLRVYVQMLRELRAEFDLLERV